VKNILFIYTLILINPSSVKSLLFAATLMLPVIAISQKVPDLDRFRFTAQFRTLPVHRLDSSYKTYSINLEGTRLMRTYLSEMEPERSVVLEGWKRLSKDGHISVDVKVEDLLPESVSVKERVEVIKDRNGKQTGTRTLYHQEVVYTFSAFADVSDYKGGHIENIVLADRGHKQVYSSPEFAVRQLAEGYFLLNTVAVTERLYKNCVTRAMHYLSERLTENYGYGEATITDQMWIIDSRKHPEYTAHRQTFLQLKDVLFGLRADKPLDGVREQLKPAIDYFESIKKKYTTTSKHDRKIRYASYYNLAVLYYYLDDPQAMLKEAAGLILNDFDAKDGRNLEASAIRLKNLFAQTKLSSRHFPIDTASFRGPYQSAPRVAAK
jgi:hypothetical protein